MKSIILTMLILETTAFAKTQTVQTLMPLDSQQELISNLTSQSGKMTYEGGETTFRGAEFNLKYYYGLSDNQAIGLEGGFHNMSVYSRYSNATTSSVYDSKSDGATDVSLKYKGNYDFSDATLYYGLGYSFSPEKAESKNLTADSSHSNSTSGQPGINLSTAVVVPVSSVKLGASVDYTDKQEGSEERVSSTGFKTSYTLTGRSSVTGKIFVELDHPYHPNFAISEKRSYSSHSVSSSGNSLTESDGFELFSAEVSAQLNIKNNFDIIPVVTYNKIKSNAPMDSWDLFSAGASARFIF